MEIRIIDGVEVAMLPPFHFKDVQAGHDIIVASPWEGDIPDKAEQARQGIAVYVIGIPIPTSSRSRGDVYIAPGNHFRHPHVERDEGYTEGHNLFRSVCTGNAGDALARAWRSLDAKGYIQVMSEVLGNYKAPAAYVPFPEIVQAMYECEKCGASHVQSYLQDIDGKKYCRDCCSVCDHTHRWVLEAVKTYSHGNVERSLCDLVQRRWHGELRGVLKGNPRVTNAVHGYQMDPEDGYTVVIDDRAYSISEVVKINDVWYMTYEEACKANMAHETPEGGDLDG